MQGECTVNDHSVDVDSKVDLANVFCRERSLFAAVGSPVCSAFVEGNAGGEGDPAGEALCFDGGSDVVFDEFGEINHFDAGFSEFAGHEADGSVDVGGGVEIGEILFVADHWEGEGEGRC